MGSIKVCQLLGISSNLEIDLDFSFREWRHRGDRNPHGYGFAYWINETPKIVKAASNLFEESPKITEELRKVRSKTFLCHVRLKSVGPQDGDNTHPFLASSGKHVYIFAHNGTVREIKNQPLLKLHPEGATDSEYAFLWLLEKINETKNGSFENRLKRYSDDIRRIGKFNFLLSDEHTLWAYGDDSLYFMERKPPYGGELVQLIDDGFRISLAEVKRPDERALLIATQPLTNESGWHKLGAGELIAVRDGQVTSRLSK